MNAAPDIPLERLLMSPAAFGLTTASPLQRAVCRIIDGLPLGDLASCAEVRAAVERTDPEVVLMDLRMPNMDGFEATRLVRATHPWIQVVFLTFYEEMLPNQSPEDVGAFAYLVKGCSIRLMCDVIAQARRHGAEQRWAGVSGA